VVGRTGLLQVDSVNVFERAHHLPLFSRLGPYERELLPRAAYVHRDLFEYWGHEASLLPVATHPLLRWRMARAAAGEEGWGRTIRVLEEHPGFVEHLVQRIRDEGPSSAGDLHVGERPAGPWWDWSLTKTALEHLFWAGRVTTSSRRGFERVYDLTERVLPPEVLATPTPSVEEAQRGLVRIAARAHGVATETDLRDYFRLGVADARAAVRRWRTQGSCCRCRSRGGASRRTSGPAAASPGGCARARCCRRSTRWCGSGRAPAGCSASTTASRSTCRRPSGCTATTCCPFLHDEALRARVDLKSDRKAGVLRVLAAWLEPGSDAGSTAQALAAELRVAAAWQGLPDVAVEPRGDLAAVLGAALR
jgi:uncharacterized protein YcaQ